MCGFHHQNIGMQSGASQKNIKMAFDEEGIEIPFKQVEISVTKM